MDDDLEDYKLETIFEPEAGCILHTSWMQDRAKGIRKIKVNDRWHRKDEIGVGSFGTVYLETTKDGRQRAVKAVRKRQAQRFGMALDHKRELAALTVFSRSKVTGISSLSLLGVSAECYLFLLHQAGQTYLCFIPSRTLLNTVSV
jgi:hypothetical protein